MRKVLPNDCIAAFGQGCSANINSFPLRTTHGDAAAAGAKLGAAALLAIEKSQVVGGNTIRLQDNPYTPSDPTVAE